MTRDFKNHFHDINIKFFVGRYQENSLVKGHNTLYIIGEPDIEEIARRLAQYDEEDDITHLFFGASHSFKVSTFEDMEEWTPTIQHFLTLDYWCTLDTDISLVNFIHETDLCSWNRFIPMLSVKVPYAKDLGYNAIIKIDDIEFNYSNYGIWSHYLHNLMSYETFTSWDAYKDDVVVMEREELEVMEREELERDELEDNS